jgi:hypothetical protein
MKAKDLDRDVECPVCGGNGEEPTENDVWGECPQCGGQGTINRYRDGPEGEVVLSERFRDEGTHAVHLVHSMPENDDGTGGFNERYGDAIPENIPTDADPDLKDRLANNPLGTNTDSDGAYTTENGKTFDDSALPNGWPNDPDLGVDEVISWLDARGEEEQAKVFRDLKKEQGL